MKFDTPLEIEEGTFEEMPPHLIESGRVIMWNGEGGYGFIKPDSSPFMVEIWDFFTGLGLLQDRGKRWAVFVHANKVVPSQATKGRHLVKGQTVRYVRSETTKGPRAAIVKVEERYYVGE